MNRIKLTFRSLKQAWKMLTHRCSHDCTEYDHIGYGFRICNICNREFE